MLCAVGTLIGRARRRANGDDDDDDECERERRRALARFERGAETATRGARGEGGTRGGRSNRATRRCDAPAAVEPAGLRGTGRRRPARRVREQYESTKVRVYGGVPDFDPWLGLKCRLVFCY